MDTPSDRRSYWNERYDTQGSVWGRDANQFIRSELGGLEPCRVLDLGCGQGRNSIWLAARGHDVTGVDFSDVAIMQARRHADEAGVTVDFQARDLETWQAPTASYDLVVLSYLQVPGELRRRVHAMAVEALAPGGRVFLIAHHRDNLTHGVGGPQSPEFLFDQGQLADDFSSLTIVRNDIVLRPAEMDGVSGDAIDVLLIADKTTV